MKKIICLIIVALFVPNIISISIADIQYTKSSEVYTMKIPIQVESYDIIKFNNEDKISIENFGQIHNPGQPKLPMKIFSICIPPNAEIQKIIYIYSDSITLNGIFNIKPEKIPEFENNKNIISEFQNEYNNNYNKIYSSNSFFPANNIRYLQKSGFRNYNLIDFEFVPFSYNPLSKTLQYIPQIIISIDYKIIEENTENDIVNAYYKDIARNIIHNFNQTQTWYDLSERTTDEKYDYVIITLDSLIEAIDPLVQWEIEKGRNVKVVTLSSIEGQYQGYDAAEKIRNFLREKYPDTVWGIRDLCIIGHWDDIPMRQTYQTLSTMTDDKMPETDYYYAELSFPDNESWDIDQDHKYGENADEIDYYAEINVGRIPWSNFDTVKHICEKTVAFEHNNDPTFKNNMLLLANMIDQNTDGATFMEYCVNETIHPWMFDWLKTRLYDKNSEYQKDYPINHANVLYAWTQGSYAVVSWNSHGNPYGSGNFISVDDCKYLNDDYPAIISGASCSNSDTNYENIGQAMMKQGGVGFLGANKDTPYRSRWDDPNDGSDQSFKYFFLSSITFEEKTMGEAHQFAISEMYQKGLWSRLMYETFAHSSLFGNPDLSITYYETNNPPEKPDKPEGSTSGRTHIKHIYSTVSTDIDGDRLYYCWSWGDDTIEWFGPYDSGEVCSVSHKWNEENTYDIKVKARDEWGSESEWSEPLPISMPKTRDINNYISWLFQFFKEISYLRFIFKLI